MSRRIPDDSLDAWHALAEVGEDLRREAREAPGPAGVVRALRRAVISARGHIRDERGYEAVAARTVLRAIEAELAVLEQIVRGRP